MRETVERIWDQLLVAYGQWLPYHPGKWRVLDLLRPDAINRSASVRLVRRKGIWYELDLRHAMDRNLFYLEHERWETRFLERSVRPNWIVLDVGANIGYYTLLLSRLVGVQGQVYAFEPVRHTYEILKRHLNLNNAINVCPYQLALADDQHAGMRPLIVPEAKPDQARLARPDEQGQEAGRVCTLDSFLEEKDIKQVDLIKIDVEGSEPLFLSGAKNTLQQFRPILMIELNPKMLALYDANAGGVVQTLRAAGYSLYRPTWRGLLPLSSLPGPGQFFDVVGLPR